MAVLFAPGLMISFDTRFQSAPIDFLADLDCVRPAGQSPYIRWQPIDQKHPIIRQLALSISYLKISQLIILGCSSFSPGSSNIRVVEIIHIRPKEVFAR